MTILSILLLRSKSTNQESIARHYNAIFEIKNIRLIITIICDAKILTAQSTSNKSINRLHAKPSIVARVNCHWRLTRLAVSPHGGQPAYTYEPQSGKRWIIRHDRLPIRYPRMSIRTTIRQFAMATPAAAGIPQDRLCLSTVVVCRHRTSRAILPDPAVDPQPPPHLYTNNDPANYGSSDTTIRPASQHANGG